MKEKMLTRLERDRIKARVHTLEAQVQQLQAEKAAATKAPATPKPPRPKRGADSKLPPRDSVPNPYASLTFDPPGIERYRSVWKSTSASGARRRRCAGFVER